jgi:hypothetical protein
VKQYYLSVRLRSDATFGRGEGVAGFVDVEIEHDDHGFPFIGGRALKGLLQEEWQNLRYALGSRGEHWQKAAELLFGTPGALLEGAATMFVGAATLPPELIAAVRDQELDRTDVLTSLTTVRRQTAIDAESGAPERGSLRAFRVLLRETPMIALLEFEHAPSDATLALLAACVLAVRRGGSVRNRGRGRLALLLHDHLPENYNDATFIRTHFQRFAQEVK